MYKIYYEGENGKRYYIDLNMKDVTEDPDEGGTWRRIRSVKNVISHVESTHRFSSPLQIEEVSDDEIQDSNGTPGKYSGVVPKKSKSSVNRNKEHRNANYTWKKKRTPEKSSIVTASSENRNAESSQELQEKSIRETLSSTWQERNADERFRYVESPSGIEKEDSPDKGQEVFSGDIFETVRAMSALMNSRKELIRRYEKSIYYEDGYELDILHKLEMHDDVDHDYVSMLRESRLRRRKAKDLLDVLKFLDQDPPDFQGAMQFIDRLDDRRYNPRVLKELFDEDLDSGNKTSFRKKQMDSDKSEVVRTERVDRVNTRDGKKSQGQAGAEIRRQSPRKEHPGNRPANTDGKQTGADDRRTGTKRPATGKPSETSVARKAGQTREKTVATGESSGKQGRPSERSREGRKSTIRLLRNLMDSGKRQNG